MVCVFNADRFIGQSTASTDIYTYTPPYLTHNSHSFYTNSSSQKFITPSHSPQMSMSNTSPLPQSNYPALESQLAEYLISNLRELGPCDKTSPLASLTQLPRQPGNKKSLSLSMGFCGLSINSFIVKF